MELPRSSPQICPIDKQCSRWAMKYLQYCLCSTKDGVSLSLGLISVLSWGVAEIPQILTNYKEKSADGLSIAFLMTWVIGDFLNLFGCMLEPATLTTQYYTAMLYTVTTLTLVTQAIYFGHIYPRLKSNKHTESIEEKRHHSNEGGNTKEKETGRKNFQSGVPLSSPIPLPAIESIERESYYASARSLSKSFTPPMGFRMHKRTSLGLERNSIEEPLLNEDLSSQSNARNTKSMLSVVSGLTFFFGTFYVQLVRDLGRNLPLQTQNQGIVLKLGRKLLQVDENLLQENGSSGIGAYLGWGMAFIYLGGRLPQICLNFKRGNAEGLNPLMFVFALVGNTTYVASILVHSLEWSKIKPNLPWLVDAGGCVVLDTLIVMQFIYFNYRKHRDLKIKSGNSSTS